MERKQRVRTNLKGREGISDAPQGSVWALCFSACLLVFWEKKMKSEVAKLADERKLFTLVKQESSCERGILHQQVTGK